MAQSDFYKDHGISVKGNIDTMRKSGQLPDLSQKKKTISKSKEPVPEKTSLLQRKIDMYNEKFSGHEIDITYKDDRGNLKGFPLNFERLSQSKNPSTPYLFFIKVSHTLSNVMDDDTEAKFVIIDTRNRNDWDIRIGNINGRSIKPADKIRSKILYSLTNNLATLRAQKFESKDMKKFKITENKTGQKFTVSALNEQEAKEKVKKYLNESGYDRFINEFSFIERLVENLNSLIQQFRMDIIDGRNHDYDMIEGKLNVLSDTSELIDYKIKEFQEKNSSLDYNHD